MLLYILLKKVVSGSERKLGGGIYYIFVPCTLNLKTKFLLQTDLLRDNWKDCSRDYTSQCHVHRVREPNVWQCSAGRWRDFRISYCWIHQYVPGNNASISFVIGQLVCTSVKCHNVTCTGYILLCIHIQLYMVYLHLSCFNWIKTYM